MADSNTNVNKQTKSFFDTKFAKTGVPLIFIAVCLVVILFLSLHADRNANNIEGKFVLTGGDADEYVQLSPEGDYVISGTEGSQKGKWNFSGGEFTFDASNGEVFNGVMIQSKYLAFKDTEFLEGEVPTGKKFVDASVEASDGTVYIFDSDGNFSKVEDGRNTKVGTYMTDGNFIVVTEENSAVTYLNCGDGITSVYYQIV